VKDNMLGPNEVYDAISQSLIFCQLLQHTPPRGGSGVQKAIDISLVGGGRVRLDVKFGEMFIQEKTG